MAVKIGTTTATTGDTTIPLTFTSDEETQALGTQITTGPAGDTSANSYGVGNAVKGMEIVVTDADDVANTDTVLTVTEVLVSAGNVTGLEVTPALDADATDANVLKLYVGVQGTQEAHTRKRLLGYI